MKHVAMAVAAAGALAAFNAGAQQKPNPMDNVPDKMPFDVPYGAPITLERAQHAVQAAVAEAQKRGWKLNVAVLDSGANLVGFARMDGAFTQSIDTSLMKAKTAASYGIPTGDIAAGIDLKLAIATRGKRINLPGGLPIIVDGHVIGGIGVGSGTGEQDKQVANAALAALPGARRF